jgi:hypothetical protein
MWVCNMKIRKGILLRLLFLSLVDFALLKCECCSFAIVCECFGRIMLEIKVRSCKMYTIREVLK